MTAHLQQRLFDAAPVLYSFRHLQVPECHCMNLGIQCPDEWFLPLMILTHILEVHNRLCPEEAIHATDVKTKMNHLRFHTDHIPTDENDFLENIIAIFEENLSDDTTWSGFSGEKS